VAESTKAVKVSTTGVKKASTNGLARAAGSSFVVVIELEGPAEAALDEA
jgi:hypothetical protein